MWGTCLLWPSCLCFEQTQEGRKAVEEAIAALKAAKPVRTLHRSAAMDKACADHVHGTSAVRIPPPGVASCGFVWLRAAVWLRVSSCGFVWLHVAVWLRVASCCCVASCGSCDCSATHHRALPFAMYTPHLPTRRPISGTPGTMAARRAID